MSNFVNALIERHTQPGNTVQPQVRSRFETNRDPATGQPMPGRFDTSFAEPLAEIFDNQQNNDKKEAFFGRPAMPVELLTTNPNQQSGPDRASRAGILTNPPRFPLVENQPLPQLDETESGMNRRTPNHPAPDTVQPAIDGPNPFRADAFGSHMGGLLDQAVRRAEPGNIGTDARPDQVSAAQAQPIIRVTIGRIDVRAVPSTPPSTPLPRSGPKPQLSLEEYLKQRNTATK